MIDEKEIYRMDKKLHSKLLEIPSAQKKIKIPRIEIDFKKPFKFLKKKKTVRLWKKP